MNEKLIVREPVYIEDNGRPVAVILPIETYEALRHREKPQEAAWPPPLPAGFLRERAAFERMLPELLKTHRGKCVAVVGGMVVEVGDDKLEVIEQVQTRFGRVSRYVQWVTDQPRIYHFPYRKIVRR